MKTPYGLDEDQQESIQVKIMDNLNVESVVRTLRKSLDAHCQEAIDATTAYLKDEYSLVIDDIVKERSKRLVQELLKGNHTVAQFFNLEARETCFGPDKGKPFVYDPEGIRKSIINNFKEEIAEAELISLREENERLRESIRVIRESRY